MELKCKSNLTELPHAESALLDLCRPFVDEGFAPRCEVAQPDEIPFPADQLLVHHEHMTVVLEKHHGSAVDVHVLEEHLDGDLYTRKISLTPQGGPNAGRPVEWGIVKLDFRFMARAVRDEILAKRLPLGAVLIKHRVLRRIKPRWFLRLPVDGPILGLFQAPAAGGKAVNGAARAMAAHQPPSRNGHEAFAYGRIGTIYCNDEPAIELLEVVLNTAVSHS